MKYTSTSIIMDCYEIRAPSGPSPLRIWGIHLYFFFGGGGGGGVKRERATDSFTGNCTTTYMYIPIDAGRGSGVSGKAQKVNFVFIQPVFN